jgi:uncharacterized protein YpmS
MLEAIFGGCGGHCGGCCLGVTLILLVCCALYVSANGPEPPLSNSFKPSAAEAQAFQSAIDSATSLARSQGWFYLTFTERQMASWMALDGQAFAKEHGHSFPFKNVQVKLDDGAITFYGELGQSQLTIPLEAIVTPNINSSGAMSFEITSVNVGGVRMPDAVLRTISRQFEDVLVQPFDNLQGTPVFYNGSLSIQGGTFIVQGYLSY